MATPAAANLPGEAERLSAYVTARAAEDRDPARTARLLSALVRELPGQGQVRKRAIASAIQAGEPRLALDLARGIPFSEAPLELRMLRIADLLTRGRSADAVRLLRTSGGTIDSGFLLPFVEAWARADAGDGDAASALDTVNPQSALASQVDEHRALILLKVKRAAEARPLADKALAEAGGRADRLRLAFADGFRAAGDRAAAAAMLEGRGPALAVGRAKLAQGRPLGEAIGNGAQAFGELLLGLAISLNRLDDRTISVALAQVARFANPGSDAATLLTGMLLDEAGRPDQAVATLRAIAPEAPFAAQAADTEIRVLLDNGRGREALERAGEWVRRAPDSDAFARLGGALSRERAFAEAAEAYSRAIALAGDRTASDAPWELHLYRAGALEEANRWPEAKAAAEAALALSPDNALVLNFLGYGMLERGEDLDRAEAMVRKASALRPDDASITDSLGWAQYKRGKLGEAIATLGRAAAGDPGQWEIREHLGDALYSAGRRIEARFEWRAALAASEEEGARKRLADKIERGLTPATAAP